MTFTHLHVHTQHSFLDGVPTLPDLCDRVQELEQDAIAITDHGEVSGHLKFQVAALAKGITPIFGMEGYFVDDVANREKSYGYNHITLLATSQVGLRNLWILSSRAYTEGMYYKPRIDFKMLEEHGEGIIATGGCLGGCIASYLNPNGKDHNPNTADERISRFVEILGERFYLELHTYPDHDQKTVNLAITERAAMYGIPTIAVSDSHYLRDDDWESHELLIAAQMGKKWNDPTRYTYGRGALAVIGEDEVRQRLLTHLPSAIVEQAIANTGKVAEMVREEQVTIEGKRTFPIFLNKQSEDELKLRKDAWQTFMERLDRFNFDEPTMQVYRERLARELELVIEKGYAGYFLIVAGVITWAKGEGILIGPGRGSAGGSLLSYVLGITEIDPVRWGLLFERFMDPAVTALPDIDIDVPQLERDLVIKYLEEKYEVAGIGTLITQAPRLLLKDFCRVLSIPRDTESAIAAIISSTPDLTVLDLKWWQVREVNAKAFEPWEAKEPKLFALMDAFAQHYRHAGAHAAGVVVNREPLTGLLPFRKKSTEETVRTQFEMKDIETLGYMKMDFLGLRNLSTLMRAFNMAKLKDPNLPMFYDWQYEWQKYYEDQDVYRSLWTGRNTGIFQVETEGVTEVARRYKPKDMLDMCAIMSLFRPGITRATDPETKLNLLEMSLQRREGRLRVSYRHELLRPILESTYGTFLYQEQVMEVCRVLGDFTPVEQAKVRKILGKTMPEEMRKFRETFISRATEKDINPAVAQEIWNDMESFGVYGFNKSHGFAYGMIAYWTTWMKHHYPAEFLTACFQTNRDDAKPYNRECRRLEIPLLGPDVNESEADFALVNGRIRYGLQGIKQIKKAGAIVQEHRPYGSVTDVLERLKTTSVNKTTLQNLILVGALDTLVSDDDCKDLPAAWSITKVALYRMFRSRLTIGPRKDKGLDEQGIFEKYRSEFEEYAEEVRVDDREFAELEYLGENVTTLPFGKWLPLIVKVSNFPAYGRMSADQEAMIGGVIKETRTFKVRKEGKNKGREMGWIYIEYPVIENEKVIDIETQQVVVFPKEYGVFYKKIEQDAPVIARVSKLKDGGFCLQKLYRMDRDL